ncbi:MAG: YraN family protein [Patescibacteria group bacterium]
MERLELGNAGESLAEEILAREGYAILAKKYRYARGEVDLVGMDHGVLAFVEVKTRTRGSYGRPAEAVDRYKRSRLIGAARHYLYTHRVQDQQCRFDVLSIFADEAGRLLRHDLIKDAFQVRGGNYF